VVPGGRGARAGGEDRDPGRLDRGRFRGNGVPGAHAGPSRLTLGAALSTLVGKRGSLAPHEGSRMTRLALAVLLLALAGPAHVHAAAGPADAFETRALEDRKETVESFKTSPMSPLAAIQRESLAK